MTNPKGPASLEGTVSTVQGRAAVFLMSAGRPHVLPRLHLLQTVLVHVPLGEDKEEDTTGEADGPG